MIGLQVITKLVYERDFFRSMASENSREASDVRNAFSLLEGSNPKAIMKLFEFKRATSNKVSLCKVV